MIEPRDIYHWLGAQALDTILEVCEIPPETPCGLVVEVEQEYE